MKNSKKEAQDILANPITLDKVDLDIIKLLKNNSEGLRVNVILKSLNLKRRSLYNRLEKLEKENIIENVYPIWRFADFQNTYLNLAQSSNKLIQSHKFSFILKLVKKPTLWDKHENRLIYLSGLDSQAKTTKWGNSKYTKLTLNQFIIHFFPDTILFINQKKYYSDDSYLALQSALEDTLKVLEHIETKLNFKFFIEDVPQFKIRSNHYVKLKDELAKRYRDNEKELRIEIDGKLRAWVDLSEPFGLETGHKDYGVEDMDRYKTFVTDIIQNNPPTNSQLTNGITNLFNLAQEQAKNSKFQSELMKQTNDLMNKYDSTIVQLLEVQTGFKDNIVLHMDVLKEMKGTMNNINTGINTLVNFNFREKSLYQTMEKKYKNKLSGSQSKLNKYFT